MDWQSAEPPKARSFLAFAIAQGMPENTKPVRVVAEWDESVEEWRPVKVAGDARTRTKLQILCWSEIPDAPANVEQ
jgi:hypothetical protein